MPVEIRVPTLGESVVDATISKWLKAEGESVTAGEALVELETDKVNVDVPAEQGGVLQRIVRAEGDTVGVGETIAIIDENGAAAAGVPSSGSQAAEAQPTAPATPQPAAAPQPTAPTPPQAAAPAPLQEALGHQGEHHKPSTPETAAQQSPETTITPATPVARRVAADYAVDVRQVPGSGPGGRITKNDVVKHIEGAPATPAPAAAPAQVAPAPAPRPTLPPAVPAATDGRNGREDRVRMSRRRQTIARRLVEAQQTAAMLTTFNEIDMTAVMEMRKRRKDAFKERHGVNLGFMSFFTKAAVGALKAFPLLNAEIQGDEIVRKHYYDIGIAVGAEEGLVVPVLRDADRKDFAQIEREIGELAKRARDGSLSIAELQGGTFTITNGGVFGSLMSTPILNTPQVGILGMHKIQERPIALDGQVVIRPMMYVALSYDHRIVDGSEAVRFLVRIKELVEDPETLLLEG